MRMRAWIGGYGASLVFYAYALFLAPLLAQALKAGLARPEPQWVPGFLLLAVLLLEPLGLRWKLLFLRRRNLDEPFTPEGSMLGLYSAAAIGHMIVTTVLGMLMLDCWGLEADPRWIGVVVTGLILKEFVELFTCAGQSAAAEAPGHWKERAADFLLLAYGAMAYTAWWEAVLDLGEVSPEGWLLKLFLLPFLGGLFVFLYLPLRLHFLLEEGFRRPCAGRARRIACELAIGAVLALGPVFL